MYFSTKMQDNFISVIIKEYFVVDVTNVLSQTK